MDYTSTTRYALLAWTRIITFCLLLGLVFYINRTVYKCEKYLPKYCVKKGTLLQDISSKSILMTPTKIFHISAYKLEGP